MSSYLRSFAEWLGPTKMSSFLRRFAERLDAQYISTAEPEYRQDISTAEPEYRQDISTAEPEYPQDISTAEPESLLDVPTRKIDWSESTRDELLEKIKSYKPEAEIVKAANILVLGQVGSGKSRFVNSISRVFAGCHSQVAIPGIEGESSTVKLGCHDLDLVEGRALPVKLYDTMGLQGIDENGIHEDDLIRTIMGHIRIDYEYNPSCAIKEDNPKYRKDPKLEDQMHCVVYVINCHHVSDVVEELLSKYKNLHEHIRNEGIPRVVILTHCDEACTKVKKDLTMVYRSKNIMEKMNEVSMKVGVPVNFVFPVKNYSIGVETSTNMDILLLSTFKHMINFAGDFIKKNTKKEEEEDDD